MTNKTIQQNIPEGWKLVKLKEISKKIGSGVTPRGGSEVYTKEGVIFLRSQNIQNGYLSLADVEYISDEIDTRMSNSKVEKNDILYNITGASIGRSALYTLDDKANVNQHVCIIRLKNEDPRFVNYFLRSSLGGKQLDSFQAGGNRQGLNYNQLGSFKFLLPRKAEQDRIVAVLETWDQAIEKLKRKIEVKKEIKKGLMQELLTGKTRLPGFKDEWKIVKLSECLIIRHGKSQKEVESADGEYPIFGTGGEFGRATKYLYNKPSVLIGRKGTIDKPRYADQPFWTVDTLFYSEIKKGNNAKYIYYIFLTINWKKYNEGSGVPSLSASTISSIKVFLPREENEQVAIAKILTVADDEIEKLQQKLNFLKDQKKYLLNNLVTGAIRTPETLSIPK